MLVGEEGEESQKVKGINYGERPGQKEVDEHMLTHFPFRNWCTHCVRGKAVANPHYKQKEKEQELPTISIDYAYMKSGMDKDMEESGMPIMVVKDRRSKTVFANVVPEKGVNSFGEAIDTRLGSIRVQANNFKIGW